MDDHRFGEPRIQQPCCALCKRSAPNLTRHHLIPRTLHNRPRIRRTSTREERHATILLCRPCHKQIHALLSEAELARNYSTLQTLAAHPEIARFVEWVARQPATMDVAVRQSRS